MNKKLIIYIFSRLIFSILGSILIWFTSNNIFLTVLSVIIFAKYSQTLVEYLFVRTYKGKQCELTVNEKRCNVLISMSVELSEDLDFERLYINLKNLLSDHNKPWIRFCLIGDLFESNFETDNRDSIIIRKVQSALSKLNEKDLRCMFIVRKRTYSESHKRYVATKKKYGGIEDIVQYLTTGVLASNCELLVRLNDFQPEYIFPIDFDTILPHKTVDRLVSYSDSAKEHGYNILIPKMISSIDGKAKSFIKYLNENAFENVSYDADPSEYPDNPSTIYSILFDSSMHFGKGLIDLYNYNLLPKGLSSRILSYDIVESGLNKICYIDDACIIEDEPINIRKWFLRYEKWSRGDWQNLIALNNVSGNAKLYIFTMCVETLWNITMILFAVCCPFFSYYWGLMIIVFEMLKAILFNKSIFGVFYFLNVLMMKSYFGAKGMIKGLIRQYITHSNIQEWKVTGSVK